MSRYVFIRKLSFDINIYLLNYLGFLEVGKDLSQEKKNETVKEKVLFHR